MTTGKSTLMLMMMLILHAFSMGLCVVSAERLLFLYIAEKTQQISKRQESPAGGAAH